MDGKGLFTHKAPTTVLFDTTGSFHSFGYEVCLVKGTYPNYLTLCWNK